MLIVRNNIKGIDFQIDKLQRYLHDKLLTAWNMDTSMYKCYPRCYRNQKQDGYVPETHDGKDYNDVFVDDRLWVVSFFGNSNVMETDNDGNAKSNVHLVFFVDLSKIKQGSEVQDEAARMDVFKILNLRLYGFNPISIVTGVDAVFAEYNGGKGKLYGRDMYPFHCFRFNLELIYDPVLYS